MIMVMTYEPVPTLGPMAPEELLQFTSCNCNVIAATGDAVARRMVSNAPQHVEFSKALHTRVSFMMELKRTQTFTDEAFDMVYQHSATS